MRQTHDKSFRCKTCWIYCKSSQLADSHHEQTGCGQQPESNKYFMTSEQAFNVRETRFTGSDVDKWRELCGMVLQDRLGDAYKNLSPCKY